MIGSKWFGSKPVCGLCKRPIMHTFVDGRTRSGRWAIMCPGCRIDQGREVLGVGLGQKYERVGSSDEFIRTA